MKWVPVFLLICFLSSGTAPLFGNGVDLMAMKRQEDERRKKLAKSKTSVNDTNVNTISVGNKKFGFVKMESEGSLPQEGVPAEPKKQNQNEADKTKTADFWQKQKTDLEERIALLKGDIENGQAELNKLWSDFYTKNIAAEQQALQLQISQLTSQIEQKRLSLTQSEAQLEDLFEKARKAGIPPGWLR
jgi:hypothetical protein